MMTRSLWLAAALLCWSAAAAGQKADKTWPAPVAKGDKKVWLKFETGMSVVDLSLPRRAEAPKDWRGLTGGGVVGVDAAVRWEHLSLGLRGRVHPMVDLVLWQGAFFGGYHLPYKQFDLSATVHVGYTGVALHEAQRGVHGVHSGALLAADLRVAGPLSLGVGLGSDLILSAPKDDDLQLGAGVTATLRLGLLL